MKITDFLVYSSGDENPSAQSKIFNIIIYIKIYRVFDKNITRRGSGGKSSMAQFGSAQDS